MRILDLFCGAGGASMGYAMAGHEVVGVDINDQPHYPFEFHQADAMTYQLDGFDVIHASPPCQAYAMTKHLSTKVHPDLVAATRERLQGYTYVIENVPGAPLINPITLCGSMFGLGVDRDRWFETSFKVPQPEHPSHRPTTKMGRPPEEGRVIQVVGHFSGVTFARRAMGIGWMTGKELAQAIPPDYTLYIAQNFPISQNSYP